MRWPLVCLQWMPRKSKCQPHDRDASCWDCRVTIPASCINMAVDSSGRSQSVYHLDGTGR